MQYERRIILVGKTGNGKSSTGNAILQREAFTHKISANAVTETCFLKSGINIANTFEYKVVDTPGLLDTEKSVSERALEIQRSVDICPGPHAFLIVFSANNRMTTDERFTIDMLRIMFGECIFNYSIVVFTNGKKFESDSAFQQFWKQNEVLVKLIELCGNRVAKIENTNDFFTENEGLESILEMIESMSGAGKTMYRYTGLKTHRSVIEEHSKTYHGKGDIHDELFEMVKKIGEKTDKHVWGTILYGILIGGGGTMAMGYLAGPAGVLNAVEATGLETALWSSATAVIGVVATKAATSRVGAAVINKGSVVGAAALRKFRRVFWRS